ncbi:MAG: cation:proton antiporter [Clostridia bacterium]|nr:cation:proton antiporter [Clostridia bacterium]
MEVLMPIGIAMTAGLLLSRLVKKLKLPAVTGYLIAGVLVGPYCLGLLGNLIGLDWLGFVPSSIENYGVLCDVALGFIAFAIGDEFRISQLKKIGKQATVIGIFQAIVATIVVDAALIGIHFLMPDKLPLEAAIILGAVATATAPAATLMVVRQYKAKGKLTDILLPVVAIDDAVGLVVFAISFGVAKSFLSADGISIVSVLVEPILEVVCSLLLGLVLGVLFSLAEKYFKSNSKRLILSITFVIMAVALSMLKFSVFGVHIGFSSLLVCMMLGTVFCNMCDFSEEIMGKTDRWTAPLFLLFFVISGAELEFDVFKEPIIIVVGIVYILTRALGKYFGAGWSARFMKCEPNIVKYLGITLFPQAGVALGMSAIVASDAAFAGTEIGSIVRNITLFAVLVYELVGPMLTKIALTKSGDITPRTVINLGEEDDE